MTFYIHKEDNWLANWQDAEYAPPMDRPAISLPEQFKHLPKPPAYGTLSVYLDKQGNPTNPTFLWTAKLGDKKYTCYRPDCQPPATIKNPNRWHGVSIAHDSRRTVTYPNIKQFEDSIFFATDHILDKYYAKK